MAGQIASLLDASETSRSVVAGLLAAERGRPVLWLPCFMGAGVLLYFGLDREPAW